MGGTGGGFLTTLLYLYETQKTGAFYINNVGKGHHNLAYIEKNFSSSSITKYHDGYLHKLPIYEIVEPDSADKPIFLYDHYPCDPEVFFSVYPDCKLVVIAIDESDKTLCFSNLFFKTNMQVSQFKDYKTNKDIPLDKLKVYLDQAPSCIEIADIFNKDIPVPETYKKVMFKIDFKKLVVDKQYLITQAINITNSVHTPYIDNFIDEYQQKQKELIQSSLPWLVDSIYEA